jgi:hypothetical protein
MSFKGNFSRTGFSRTAAASEFFELTIQAVSIGVASLTTMFVSLITIVATTVAISRIKRVRVSKLIKGVAVAAVEIHTSIGKGITAVTVGVGNLSRKLSLKRTITATATATAHAWKRMYLSLLATSVAIASRIAASEVFGWEFHGDFAPGDRILIDGDKLLVTHNGANVMHLVDGNIPFLNPGDNILKYTDSEGERTITLTVQWRGRWL